jgi:hypothetical protein
MQRTDLSNLISTTLYWNTKPLLVVVRSIGELSTDRGRASRFGINLESSISLT